MEKFVILRQNCCGKAFLMNKYISQLHTFRAKFRLIWIKGILQLNSNGLNPPFLLIKFMESTVTFFYQGIPTFTYFPQQHIYHRFTQSLTMLCIHVIMTININRHNNFFRSLKKSCGLYWCREEEHMENCSASLVVEMQINNNEISFHTYQDA